ncbi:MAG: sigma 54-interacting transcriptional regulator [Eggerthellaceae bacterium]|nr:sigma 54-interacting transcriptional regulator [Eggerthellaceae bacterium]
MNDAALSSESAPPGLEGLSEEARRESWDMIPVARRLFIEDGTMPEPSPWLRPEILDSWSRCRMMGVVSDSSKLAMPVSEDDLMNIKTIYANVIEAAHPLMDIIDELELASEYIFELISRNGLTLLRTGNMNLHSIVARDSLMNESTMGTNAHTLCMKYARPMQVMGPEHYCSALDGIAGLASPVFDKSGRVVASFLLTQPLPKDPWSEGYHRLLMHAQAMISSVCFALENEVSLQDSLVRVATANEKLTLATEKSQRIRNMFEAAVGSSNDAVIVIDASGRIQHASPEAIHVLRTTPASVLDQSIDSVLGLAWPDEFMPLLEKPNVKITANANGRMLDVSGNAVRNLESEELDGFVARISKHVEASGSSRSAKPGEDASITFADILGTSNAIHEATKVALRYAMTSENVLITGESGTGKEYFAQAIHNASRASGPFMSMNCAAIPPRLIESELFGYESGAFTGADRAGKPGKIELADKGTLFLDEIGDMPLELQATLLRVLENKRVMRLGGKSYKQVDFRVVAATNRSLPKMVEDGLFREDLLYRLSILTVSLPPLRMRNGDVMFFAFYYLNECRRKTLEGPTGFTPEAEKMIREFSWPGNVRQIKNAIYSAFYAAVGDHIDVPDLPQYLREGTGMFDGFDEIPMVPKAAPAAQVAPEAAPEAPGSVPDGSSDEQLVFPTRLLSMDALQESAIRLAMMYAQGNVAKAAETLQISKATLYRKLKEYGLK